MAIDDIRINQRSQQSNAIKSRREVEGVVRIGDRDPVTGRYQVLEPDGGIDPNGIKVFNSQEQYGDRVLPFRRIDGAIGLDSEKGSKARTPTAFPKCPGYLANQVFNCEEPKPVPKDGKIWILFLYDNRLYVGGHKQSPELIYNPIPPGVAPGTSFSALPVDVRNNVLDIEKYAQIWGDDQGWEASYGIKHPAPLVGFAIEGGNKNSPSYVRTPLSIASFVAYGNSEVAPVRLGKGLLLRYEGVLGDPSSSGYTQSWKNTIADFDGASKGSGYSVSSGSFSGNASTSNSRVKEVYPTPHSTKGDDESYSSGSQLGSAGNPPSDTEANIVNSFKILHRDRFQAFFCRRNEQSGFTRIGGLNPSFQSSFAGTTEYLISDGKKDSTLFSLPGVRNTVPPLPRTGFYPTFNFPFVTDLGDAVPIGSNAFGTKYQHLDSTREYNVRVYDVYSKSSLIDGFFEEVTVSAWGIPDGSRVLYTASWVQP